MGIKNAGKQLLCLCGTWLHESQSNFPNKDIIYIYKMLSGYTVG